jgi:putative ABC transport system permease protein
MIRKIAWKNILNKPLNSGLCVSLLLFGVAIISLLVVVQHHLENKFERDLKDIDLVIGAKGSPLQLVLSAVYHVDAPTGNIKLSEAEKIMNSPMVKKAIPMAYGDSYNGYRILGTTTDYIEKYEASYLEGRAFQSTFEAVLGFQVAQKMGLQLGDTFVGTHGEAKGGQKHEDQKYTVVGILRQSNAVLDQLVLTNVESVWSVHNAHAHKEAKDHKHDKDEQGHEHNKGVHNHEHGEDGHHHEHEHEHSEDEHNHEHSHDEAHDHDHSQDEKASDVDKDQLELTAVLLQFKTKMAKFTMPRIVNEQTNMQAVLPALEINRLIYMIGVGATTINFIAGGILFMACFSIFFALYSRLKERKYELAVLRTVGYRPISLFGLLIFEGFLLAGLGYILGWMLSRVGLYFINQQAESAFNYQFEYTFINNEWFVLLATILVGILSALVPALRAMRIDISKTLSEK